MAARVVRGSEARAGSPVRQQARADYRGVGRPKHISIISIHFVVIKNRDQCFVLTCCSFLIPSSAMSLKRKRRVLAIDDEPSMTEWLKILLEHAGYEVRTALIGTRGE